jgi:hypothetical protein
MINATDSLPNHGDETIVRTMDLPDGQDSVIFADCNLVGLSSRLDDAGRQRVLHVLGVTTGSRQ